MMSAASTACSASRAAAPCASSRSSSACPPIRGRRRNCFSGCAEEDDVSPACETRRNIMTPMIRFVALSSLSLASLGQASGQGASDEPRNYPNRAIRMVVPFPPGGPADLIARFVGQKTIKELIAKAKANPGKLNMGAGTITSRLGALLFAKTAGIDVQLVPFKGSAEIGQAVLAGTVDFALDSTGTSLPLIQGGQ